MKHIFIQIVKWLLFFLATAAVVVVILNFRYFSLQFKFLVSGQPPKIEAPKVQTSTATTTPQTVKANYLWIPSLGIEAPVVYATEANETAFQAALATGVVHFPETAKPGEFGNVYLFGHSSDYAWSKGAYKTVFALLTKIQPGTEILVSDSVGDLFTYKVKEAFVAGSKDVKYLSQEKYEKKLLTLQTSYPIGTALKRYIVRAEILPQK
jgi:LPXTG-site transpeptidase (sortase) family protein